MELIGATEAAEILGIHRVTVWDWVQKGLLKPAAMAGTQKRRRPLFDRAYIVAFAEQQKHEQLTATA